MRILIALAAGLVAGVIFTESITAGVQLLTPATDISGALAGTVSLPHPAAGGLLLAWLSGGVVTGSLSTAVAQRRTVGWLGGLLLAAAAVLTFRFAASASTMVYAAPVAALIGAIGGAMVAHRLGSR